MSFAIVSIVGNLTRPPEQTAFASGKTRTTFVVAVYVRSRNTEKPSDGADFYSGGMGQVRRVSHDVPVQRKSGNCQRAVSDG